MNPPAYWSLYAPSKRSYLAVGASPQRLAALGLALMLIGVFFGIFMLGSIVVGAGWEPTSRRKVRKMLEMSGAGPSDVVYDLGSGDGRIVLEAARTFNAKAVGVEADPLRVLFSRLAVAVHHLKGKVTIVWGNFFHVDLSEATIVTLFLSQGTNKKLKSKLLAELKPGTRVVSYVWTFDDWTPVSKDVDDELSLYTIQPARPEPFLPESSSTVHDPFKTCK